MQLNVMWNITGMVHSNRRFRRVNMIDISLYKVITLFARPVLGLGLRLFGGFYVFSAGFMPSLWGLSLFWRGLSLVWRGLSIFGNISDHFWASSGPGLGRPWAGLARLGRLAHLGRFGPFGPFGSF